MKELEVKLLDKAKFYSKELWNLEYDGEIAINKRLRSTHAWYIEWDNKIEFNKIFLSLNNEYFLDETLIHELCHWYCHKIKVNSNDGDYEFEKEIYDCGSRSTETSYIENGDIILEDSEAWFYCKNCSNGIKKHYKIKKGERINHYRERYEDAKPKCQNCGHILNYYCEANHNERWVKYYPRTKLIELNNKYKEKQSI